MVVKPHILEATKRVVAGVSERQRVLLEKAGVTKKTIDNIIEKVMLTLTEKDDQRDLYLKVARALKGQPEQILNALKAIGAEDSVAKEIADEVNTEIETRKKEKEAERENILNSLPPIPPDATPDEVASLLSSVPNMSKAQAIGALQSHFEGLSKKRAQFYVEAAFTDNEAEKGVYDSAEQMAQILASKGTAQTLGAAKIAATFGIDRSEAMSLFRAAKRKEKDPEYVPGASNAVHYGSPEALMNNLVTREAFMAKNAGKLKIAFTRKIKQFFGDDMADDEIESQVAGYLEKNGYDLGRSGLAKKVGTDDFLSMDIQNIKSSLLKRGRVMAEQKLTSASFLKKFEGKVLRNVVQKIVREFRKLYNFDSLDKTNADHIARIKEVPNFDELSAVVLDVASKIDFTTKGIDPAVIGPMSTGTDVLSPMGGPQRQANKEPEAVNFEVGTDQEYLRLIKDKTNLKLIYTLDKRPTIVQGYANSLEGVADLNGIDYESENAITAVRTKVDDADVLVVDARAKKADKASVKDFLKKTLRRPKTPKTAKLQSDTVVVFVKGKVGSNARAKDTVSALTESLLCNITIIEHHLGEIFSA